MNCIQAKNVKSCVVLGLGIKNTRSAPAQVGCMRQVLGPGALGSQRDRVEREVGGGIGMGNTCKSMANSCQCMTKTTTIL